MPEWTISDDELANCPSYGWPLRCAWCGWGDNRVKAPDCHGITFVCQMCGKPSRARRSGNSISTSPGARIPLGCLLLFGVVVAVLAWRYLL